MSDFVSFSNLATASSTQVPTETPCVTISGAPLDWANRGTSHVDFANSEGLPLLQGRFLGYGVHGGVYETTCKGISLAWKRKYCRTKIGSRERTEIEIIKRLDHRHIIKLVGTYTQGPFLGLLIWPVAVCDLATFIEDVDLIVTKCKSATEDVVIDSEPDILATGVDDDERTKRLEGLGVSALSLQRMENAATEYLDKSMGCMAGAVAYLHQQGIKHKDLKPSNVLLSHDGLWLADFGTATDVSLLTQSLTENGERGTPKYFAPEVATYEPRGRSADTFSLGCIFLEMSCLSVGYNLDAIKALRPFGDKSFHSNLESIIRWLKFEGIYSRTASDDFMMGLIRSMMSEDPANRPTAEFIEEEIALISGFNYLKDPGNFCGECCTPARSLGPHMPHDRNAQGRFLNITSGNTYHQPRPNYHTYKFFVDISEPSLDECVHLFLLSELTPKGTNFTQIMV